MFWFFGYDLVVWIVGIVLVVGVVIVVIVVVIVIGYKSGYDGDILLLCFVKNSVFLFV